MKWVAYAHRSQHTEKKKSERHTRLETECNKKLKVFMKSYGIYESEGWGKKNKRDKVIDGIEWKWSVK